MRISSIILILLATGFSSFTSFHQQTGPWKFLGEKNISFQVGRDIINMEEQPEGYRKLRLRVSEGPVNISTIKIYFVNGEVQELPLQKILSPGGRGFVIDLNGGIQILSKIEFIYETAGYKDGRSRLAVWGRK